MEKINLNEIKVFRREGGEHFHSASKSLEFNLLEFWQWNQSNLLENRTRGILAEFIVMKALGIKQEVRTEWDAFDLITNEGIKIEVKSAAYIQSWEQKKLSAIQFNIKPTRVYQNGKYSNEAKRQADYYVLCLLHHKDQNTIDPMILDQWTFYVVKKVDLDKEVGVQATIGLRKLVNIASQTYNYKELSKLIF